MTARKPRDTERAVVNRHPFKVMQLKVGTEVWIRARIKSLSEPGTLGYAHGMLVATAVTHGLNQDAGDPQVICTDIWNIRKTGHAAALKWKR